MEIHSGLSLPSQPAPQRDEHEVTPAPAGDLPIHDPTLGRPVQVHLAQDLGPGEGIDLAFRHGPCLPLRPTDTRTWEGSLDPTLLGQPFEVTRRPDGAREVGIGGQRVPPHAAPSGEGPLWLFPVAWEDRLARSLELPDPDRLIQHTLEISRWVDVPRAVKVLLPRAYHQYPTRRFPLVLALDGQNLFDPRNTVGGVSWNLHQVADRLEASGAPPFVLVAVDNGGGSRTDEYCPYATEDVAGAPPSGGRAEAHLEFLLHELLPLLRREYRLQPGPGALMGANRGGLFALWAAVAHPEAFAAVAALSPSVWWADAAILRQKAGEGTRPRVYLDLGAAEDGTCVWEFHAARNMLLRHGWSEGKDLSANLIQGAAHHEASWSARAGDVLRFLVTRTAERRRHD